MRFTHPLDSRGIALASAIALLVGCSSTDAPSTNNEAAGASAGAAAGGGAGAQAGGGATSGASAGSSGSAATDGGMSGNGGTVTAGGSAGTLAGGAAGTAGIGATGGDAAGSGNAGGASGAGGDNGGAAGSVSSSGASGYNPCPAKGTPCAIMPLGDSITFGYGSSDDMGGKNGGGYRVEIFTKAIAAGVTITFVGGNTSGPAMVAGKPFPKANEGYSGFTIDQVSAKIDSTMSLSKYKPDIVLMMVGTNDMHGNVDVANAPTRLGKIIDKVVAQAPNALLVVAAPIPANGSQDGLTQTFNAKVPGVVQTRAAAGKHVIFVDMYTPMAPWNKARFNDSEHPNDAGYKIMGDTWWTKIGSFFR